MMWDSIAHERVRRESGSQGPPSNSEPIAQETWHTQAGTSILRIEPRGVAHASPLLFVHGGGWVFGSVRQSLELARRIADQSHRVVESLEYSLAPEHPFPTAADEVLRSVQNRTSSESPYAAVVGMSAGAQLVLSGAVRSRERGKTFPPMVLFYGSYAMNTDGPSHRRLGDMPGNLSSAELDRCHRMYAPTERLADQADMTKAVLSDLPPIWLSCGDLDPLIMDTLQVYRNGMTAGLNVHLDVVPGGRHGFVNPNSGSGEAPGALRRALDWVTQLEEREPAG